jgi:hypothetical protein
MAMSGHQSESAFNSYLCNTNEQEREAVMEVWDQKYSNLLFGEPKIDEKEVIKLLVDSGIPSIG